MTDINTQIVQTKVLITTSDGQMPAFLFTHPEGGQKPAVLLLMEAFGLTSHIQNVATRIARIPRFINKTFSAIAHTGK
ncbi:dienelactone hydrolase family protein [Fortiea contorta]|uniref:dienelactone hydrolase family protein n=1 Tax=Fortiea contorta TaxID=1892405 RepID=UPI00036977E5|nr:hypothetical protein [Fortiea contorta]